MKNWLDLDVAWASCPCLVGGRLESGKVTLLKGWRQIGRNSAHGL